jgi:hypothetical protein
MFSIGYLGNSLDTGKWPSACLDRFDPWDERRSTDSSGVEGLLAGMDDETLLDPVCFDRDSLEAEDPEGGNGIASPVETGQWWDIVVTTSSFARDGIGFELFCASGISCQRQRARPYFYAHLPRRARIGDETDAILEASVDTTAAVEAPGLAGLNLNDWRMNHIGKT